MSAAIQETSRLRTPGPALNAGLSFSARRGTFLDLYVGGYQRVLINDDICADEWESSELVAVLSVIRAPGALHNDALSFSTRRGTAYDLWAGRYASATRGASCGTGFTGVYVEAPRLLIDAGGTGGPSGVAGGGARRSFH